MILFFAASAIIFIELKGITVIILEVAAVILSLLFLFYYKIDAILKLMERFSAKIPVFEEDIS